MRRTTYIMGDPSEAHWVCRCGNKYIEVLEKLSPLFHRDAIALIQYGDNREPIAENPNAKYGVLEITDYYLNIDGNLQWKTK